MPELRQREDATRAELQSIADQTTDRTAYLRLAETLTAFLARLRSSAETLDIIERQRVAIHERPSPDHSRSAVAGHASYSSRASGVGSGEAPIEGLASARRSNGSCSFPASRFHEWAFVI